MEAIYKNEDFLTVYLLKDKKYIMFKWKKFGIPLDELQKAHEVALDSAVANAISSYMAETSEATGTLLPAAVQWWEQTWVPKLQSSIVTKIATVVPKSALASFSTKDWQAVDFDSITLQNAKTVAEAEAFLASS